MLYGRDVERQLIETLLDGARSSRSGVLVIRGEAGIGKTALLEDAWSQASDMQVLSARGVEAESELPFAALHQLVWPALGHLDQVPPPQAAALRAALGLADGRGGHERFLVFAACLSLLAELAEQRPVLCVVDDAHWLDEASADALRFVARRLDAEAIVILFGAREGEQRTFEAAGLPSLQLAGLDAEAADAVLSRGAGLSAAPAVKDLLVEQSRGNPLALVELPSALTDDQLAGREPLPETLPMTRQLEHAFLSRARDLPRETQVLLLVAAADDSEDVALVANAAARLGAENSALDAAEDAGLVIVQGRRLEFRHPLVRSAVYDAATSVERREAHASLAAALSDDDGQADRRAWHLASSAIDPDHDVVRALDDAADRAEARNGHIAAAKALERAAELSVERDERGRRLTRAAGNLSLAGRDDAALLVANRADALVADPALKAELAHVRTLAAIRSGRPHDVVPVLVSAARELAPTDPARAIRLLIDAADAVWQGGDRAGYLEVAALAKTIAPPPGDDTSAIFVQSLEGFAALIEGRTDEGSALLGPVATWGESVEEPRHVVWASFAAQWLGDDRRWEALVDRAASLARDRGELGMLADTLGMRANQLALEQRLDESAVAATEALELAREIKAENLELYPRAAFAVIAAIRGADEEAERQARHVLDLSTRNGLRLRASTAVYALALADMGRGRWPESFERLGSMLDGGAGTLDPLVGPVIPDRIEAAARAARGKDAADALAAFEAWTGYSGARSARPRLEASRALVANGAEATERFEAALALADDARPFDLARIRLLYGEHLRRERKQTAARVQLRSAIDGFERLRADAWAERGRRELRATGEAARKRDPTTVSQLTPQELQVAKYVSEGLSNKEVAARLFLSPRTIDAHLRNVFAKLEITSRTQLARLSLGGAPAAFIALAAAVAAG
jgi:DNA-binding CsgD family transcriptional regulator